MAAAPGGMCRQAGATEAARPHRAPGCSAWDWATTSRSACAERRTGRDKFTATRLSEPSEASARPRLRMR